jgi:hypothetical protein
MTSRGSNEMGPIGKYHKTSLPVYTTERYYLLSELEQHGSFIFADEALFPSSSSSARRTPFVALYVLWNAGDSKGANGLVDKIKGLVNFMIDRRKYTAKDVTSFFLAVEVLATTTGQQLGCDDTNRDIIDIDKVIEDMWSKVKRSIDIEYIVFGVSDHVGGTPALEAVHDFAVPISTNHQMAQILASTRNEMLGHDSTREPDAAGNVRQYLLASRAEPAAEYSRELIRQFSEVAHLQKKELVDTKQRKGSKGSDKASNNKRIRSMLANISIWNHAWVAVMIVVVFVAIVIVNGSSA